MQTNDGIIKFGERYGHFTNKKYFKSKFDKKTIKWLIFNNLKIKITNLWQWNKSDLVPTDIIEEMYLQKRQIAFFKLVDTFYILPVSFTGNFDVYGRPIKLMVHPYRGFNNFTIKSYFLPTELNRDDVALLWDRYNDDSPLMQCMPLINAMCDQMQLLINVTVVGQMQLMTGADPAKGDRVDDVIISAIDDCLNGMPYMIADNKYMLQPIAGKLSNISTNEIWLNIQSFYNLILEMLGLAGGAIWNKKERLTAGESDQEKSEYIIYLMDEYKTRKRFIDEINEKFNINLSFNFFRITDQYKKLAGDVRGIKNDD